MRKSQVKSGANTRNKSTGKNVDQIKAQFGNHKNMMLEGDSEYSDIDINSDEEQKSHNSAKVLLDRSESDYRSEKSNLSNYSHSRPDEY